MPSWLNTASCSFCCFICHHLNVSDPPYPPGNTLDHASLYITLSNGPVAEITLVNELGYPVSTTSGNSGTLNDRTIREIQREFTERSQGALGIVAMSTRI